ncbi:MAG: S41 family peptidase [Ignavibacteriaceae bacterium]
MRIFFSLIIFIVLSDLNAQTTVTFRLNMDAIIEKGLFSPAKNEKVFVRGSFNQWNENNCELIKNKFDNIYTGKLNSNVNIGDTIEYKFILTKSNDRIYWEKDPDPDNPNHGNRKLIITNTDTLLPVSFFSYDEYIKFPVLFGKEKLQEDFREMRKMLEENHPALYDYTDKQKLDSLLDYHYSLINRPLEFNEFYKSISSVLSKVGCGHTKLWLPSDYRYAVPDNFFPLKLSFSNKKVYVSGYYSHLIDIPLGSEVLSINKKPIYEIVEALESITSSDAFIQAFRSKSVEKNFAKNYALYYGYPDFFRVKFIAPGKSKEEETGLLPVSLETINKYPVRGNELSLKLPDNINAALITINSFIYYEQREMFRKFIDSSFLVIQNKKIKNLVVDLRGNDGGDPFCSSYLLSYIENEPVPYFAEIYGRYKTLSEPIPAAANNFKGNIYTLIDGSCFSTTGHFCALLKYNHIGKLVGTETGATFTCTGSVIYKDLKNTRLILGTARKQRYDAAVSNMDRTKGVMPDYYIERSQNDIVTNTDAELNFVLELINNKLEN